MTQKRILCCVLVLLMAILAACTPANTQTPTTTAPGSTSNAEGTPAAVDSQTPDQEADPYKKYDPPITISTIRSIDETSDNMKYLDGQDAENNVIYDIFYDLMGIKVTNKIVAAPNAGKDKMQLAIATNDIPDFGTVEQTMLEQMIKADMVEDMTDYYNAYASDNLREVLGQFDNALFAPVTKDGRIYGLPSPTTIYDFTPVLWINKTWRENLGIAVPTTMDEVFDLAMAFTTQDPDGNGKNDTYGYHMSRSLDGLNFIMNAYGVYTPAFNNDTTRYMMWIKGEDGNYTNGVTDPKALDVLAKFNTLYAAGGIDPEFAIKDTSKANENIAAGKVGIYQSFFYGSFSAADERKNFPNDEWEAISLPAAEAGEKFVPGVPLNVYGYFYVRKDYENPEALVVMMNHVMDGYGAPWLVEDGPTEFDVRYTALANDPLYAGKSLNNWMPVQVSGNINWGPVFKAAIDEGATELKGKQADYDRVTKTEDPEERWKWEKIYLEAYFAAEYEDMRFSDYNGSPTPTWVQTKAMLDKEHLEAYVGFIMGQRPLTAEEFAAFAKTYDDLGAEKIAQEIKEAVQ